MKTVIKLKEFRNASKDPEIKAFILSMKPAKKYYPAPGPIEYMERAFAAQYRDMCSDGWYYIPENKEYRRLVY
jgi:hypothetical protein